MAADSGRAFSKSVARGCMFCNADSSAVTAMEVFVLQKSCSAMALNDRESSLKSGSSRFVISLITFAWVMPLHSSLCAAVGVRDAAAARAAKE